MFFIDFVEKLTGSEEQGGFAFEAVARDGAGGARRRRLELVAGRRLLVLVLVRRRQVNLGPVPHHILVVVVVVVVVVDVAEIPAFFVCFFLKFAVEQDTSWSVGSLDSFT